jgi:hypothetical protein
VEYDFGFNYLKWKSDLGFEILDIQRLYVFKECYNIN